MSQLKYCFTCEIYKPFRSTHCHVCNNCIHGFDHHCMWLGTCIGGGNYVDFLLYIMCLQVSTLLVMALSVHQFVALLQDGPAEQETSKELTFAHFALPALSLVLLIVYGLVVVLQCFHLRLLHSNQSTYELLRGAWKTQPNPADAGSLIENAKCRIHKWRKSKSLIPELVLGG